jgi:asparagine synthase (glutamine-hydrolysing)
MPRSARNLSVDFKLRRWLRGAETEANRWIPTWMAPLGKDQIARLFGDGPLDDEDLYSEAVAAWNASEASHPIDRALDYFTNFYLQDGILVKADRASMLNGLELRTPFLDQKLVDFVQRLPRWFKYQGGQRKRLLKKAFASRIPDQLLYRRKKGFGIPLSSWLREMPPPDHPLPPIMDERWLRSLWDEHRANRADHRNALWCWLALSRHYGSVGNAAS